MNHHQLLFSNRSRQDFEPARENPNRFLVCRLNHSATTTCSGQCYRMLIKLYILKGYKTLKWSFILHNRYHPTQIEKKNTA